MPTATQATRTYTRGEWPLMEAAILAEFPTARIGRYADDEANVRTKADWEARGFTPKRGQAPVATFRGKYGARAYFHVSQVRRS